MRTELRTILLAAMTLATTTISACVMGAEESAEARYTDELGDPDPWCPMLSSTGECITSPINWAPSPARPDGRNDWDIVGVVQRFQSEAPADEMHELEDELAERPWEVASVSFDAYVEAFPPPDPGDCQEHETRCVVGRKHAAVEVTRGVIDVPFEDFVAALPPDTWGVELTTRLDGQVIVDLSEAVSLPDGTATTRVRQQVERMVLSPFPCGPIEAGFLNNDMTKVEVIEYRDGTPPWNFGRGVTVYWRVMYSDNDSTEMDIGSVDFSALGEWATQVTFHSAHRLGLRGAHMPTAVLVPFVDDPFRGFVERYRDLVLARLGY